jgi:GR25 family glycosyltransferase involved in LPS biosynthesis
MLIKVISLKRTPERLRKFKENNKKINYEIFEAIDGNQLDRYSNILEDFFNKEIKYSSGAIGCALSHIQLWIEAVEKNQILTICEDDAILNHDFEKIVNDSINKLPENWAICHWSWNLDSFLVIDMIENMGRTIILTDQNQFINNTVVFQNERISPKLHKLIRSFGTSCYSISPEGATQLINKCLPLGNFELFFQGLNKNIPNNGIDIAMNNFYETMDSYVAIPPLAFTPNIHEISTVQNS